MEPGLLSSDLVASVTEDGIPLPPKRPGNEATAEHFIVHSPLDGPFV